MTRKYLTARRKRTRALMVEDAKHRCAVCHRVLPRTGVKMLWADPRMFCSQACLDDATERKD